MNQDNTVYTQAPYSFEAPNRSRRSPEQSVLSFQIPLNGLEIRMWAGKPPGFEFTE